MGILVSKDGTVARVLNVPDQCDLGSDPKTGVLKELLAGFGWFSDTQVSKRN